MRHDQAGIGAAEAEGVGQDELDVTAPGLVRHEVDAGEIGGIVEVEGRRDDLVAHGKDAKIASTAPAAPSRWPTADLVDDMETRVLLAHQALHRVELDLVAERRRGAVRVDVVDVGRRDAGALDRRLHGAEGAVAASVGAVMW